MQVKKIMSVLIMIILLAGFIVWLNRNYNISKVSDYDYPIGSTGVTSSLPAVGSTGTTGVNK
jgi:hypothetical protein